MITTPNAPTLVLRRCDRTPSTAPSCEPTVEASGYEGSVWSSPTDAVGGALPTIASCCEPTVVDDRRAWTPAPVDDAPLPWMQTRAQIDAWLGRVGALQRVPTADALAEAIALADECGRRQAAYVRPRTYVTVKSLADALAVADALR